LARVELRGVAKTFPGGIEAVGPIDLAIEEGALFVIVGPSGSGKSTLLRLIAGLEAPTAGTVWLDGRRADGLAPRDRDVAMVFQTPVVYPHLSVFENLAFGLRARGTPRKERQRRVAEAAAVLGLEALLQRRPATLSGGQRQRVALGRALVRRPRVLLLDEPFSSLDAPLRAAIRSELLELHERLGTTMIHVTHDQAEALALGSRIAVLQGGRVVQIGAPFEVYEHPACRFVAEFVGSPPMNVLPCLLKAAAPGEFLRLGVVGAGAEAAWTIHPDEPWAAPLRRRGAGRIDLGLRAEHIRIRERSADAPLVARTIVHRLEPLGSETVATLTLGLHALSVRLSPHTAIDMGSDVEIALDPRGIVWFDPDTGRALG
jgi:ABC-type sugar transport system ATPase subunit